MNDFEPNDAAELVASADRTRPPSEIERRRLRAALEVDIQRAARASGSRSFPGRGAEQAEPGRAWSRSRVVVVAAASVVLVGLASLSWYRTSNVESPGPAVSIPGLATGASVRALCVRDVAELNDAVTAWGTVEDWSAALDGTPDVSLATLEVLRALAERDETLVPLTDDVRAVVAERRAADFGPGAVLAEHARVVRSGLLGVLESLARLDPERVCPTAGIREALTR